MSKWLAFRDRATRLGGNDDEHLRTAPASAPTSSAMAQGGRKGVASRGFLFDQRFSITRCEGLFASDDKTTPAPEL